MNKLLYFWNEINWRKKEEENEKIESSMWEHSSLTSVYLKRKNLILSSFFISGSVYFICMLFVSISFFFFFLSLLNFYVFIFYFYSTNFFKILLFILLCCDYSKKELYKFTINYIYTKAYTILYYYKTTDCCRKKNIQNRMKSFWRKRII